MAGKPAAKRIGVLVLGMHRSGTSALSRVMSLLGCDLPRTLMPADPSNEAGHWESPVIARLNDEILDSAGSNWHDWLAFNPGWHSSPKAAEYKEKALAVLEGEFGQSRLFVLKDPRICRFVPFWLDVLEAAGVQPLIVMPVRNPLEVAESLSLRNGIDPAFGHLIWLRHVLEAEAGSRSLPRFHTSYEGLLTCWPRLAAGAQDMLGIRWPRLSPLTSEEIDAFLTDGLRHHQESPKSVSDNPLLSAWLREAFAIFSRWAEGGETAEDYATLDRIRAELDSAAPAFSRLISAEVQSVRKVKSLDASLKEAQGRLAEAEYAALVRQQRAEALERELGETRTALDEAHGELSHRQSELAQRRAELDDATVELRQAEQRHAEELKAERTRLSARFDEIASLTRLLREKEEEGTGAKRRLEEADRARQQEADRAERLATELEEERTRTSAELQKLRQEKGAAEGRLAERFSEIAVMTRLLGEKEDATLASDERAAWLREVSAVLLNGSGSASLKGRLAALLAAPIRLKKQKARLKRNGIFDPDAYLAAHPDVAEAGLDPLWHYINHGIGEGRRLNATNEAKEHKGNHETST